MYCVAYQECYLGTIGGGRIKSRNLPIKDVLHAIEHDEISECFVAGVVIGALFLSTLKIIADDPERFKQIMTSQKQIDEQIEEQQ